MAISVLWTRLFVAVISACLLLVGIQQLQLASVQRSSQAAEESTQEREQVTAISSLATAFGVIGVVVCIVMLGIYANPQATVMRSYFSVVVNKDNALVQPLVTIPFTLLLSIVLLVLGSMSIDRDVVNDHMANTYTEERTATAGVAMGLGSLGLLGVLVMMGCQCSDGTGNFVCKMVRPTSKDTLSATGSDAVSGAYGDYGGSYAKYPIDTGLDAHYAKYPIDTGLDAHYTDYPLDIGRHISMAP